MATSAASTSCERHGKEETVQGREDQALPELRRVACSRAQLRSGRHGHRVEVPRLRHSVPGQRSREGAAVHVIKLALNMAGGAVIVVAVVSSVVALGLVGRVLGLLEK